VTNFSWGLLGPEFLSSKRRTRTLGLGRSIRHFNDLAVPGLGGVWFGKQLFLATLGVIVAEQARAQGANVHNIEVANAIEALACWIAFESNDWNRDPRLHGSTKLRGRVQDDFKYSLVKQRNFYVTQPMRMSTVQALFSLGLVESNNLRFNAFRSSDEGKAFIDVACQNYHPKKRSVVHHLSMWVSDKERRVVTDTLRGVLSPLIPLSNDSISLLRERLLQGGNETINDKQRRCNILQWVENIRISQPPMLTWENQPIEIANDHWHDLNAGRCFFKVREKALKVLELLETHIGNKAVGRFLPLHSNIPSELISPIEDLRTEARVFLKLKHNDKDANAFCRKCEIVDPSQVLRFLVDRDSIVLRLVGDVIKPGPAFHGSVLTEGGTEAELNVNSDVRQIPLPEGLSYRVQNLFLLNADMHNKLPKYLNQTEMGVNL